jgi:uncharacterized protein YuzE
VKITYDAEADALYIQLRELAADDSLDIEEGVTADLDRDGHLIGIEVLDARERLGAAALANVSLEQFPLNPEG